MPIRLPPKVQGRILPGYLARSASDEAFVVGAVALDSVRALSLQAHFRLVLLKT